MFAAWWPAPPNPADSFPTHVFSDVSYLVRFPNHVLFQVRRGHCLASHNPAAALPPDVFSQTCPTNCVAAAFHWISRAFHKTNRRTYKTDHTFLKCISLYRMFATLFCCKSHVCFLASNILSNLFQLRSTRKSLNQHICICNYDFVSISMLYMN